MGYWNNFPKHSGICHPDRIGESSSKDTLWIKIWNLKKPPKVRIFIWKLAHEAITTEANLNRHHISVNPRCAICGLDYTYSTHVLIFCQGTKEIWKHSEWWHVIKNLKGLKTKDFIFTMDACVPRPAFGELCTKLWVVWKDRFNFTHKAQHRAPLYAKGSTTH